MIQLGVYWLNTQEDAIGSHILFKYDLNWGNSNMGKGDRSPMMGD
jgi:hypothetical protein